MIDRIYSLESCSDVLIACEDTPEIIHCKGEIYIALLKSRGIVFENKEANMTDENQKMYDDEAAYQCAYWAQRKVNEAAMLATNPMPLDPSAHSVPNETPYQFILRRNQ